MLALFHSTGRCPVSKENWYRRLSIGASSSAVALRIKVGIPSAPGALYSFRFFGNFFTPFMLTVMSCIDGYGLGPLSEMLLVSSCV